jgi:hypothetical protein
MKNEKKYKTITEIDIQKIELKLTILVPKDWSRQNGKQKNET